MKLKLLVWIIAVFLLSSSVLGDIVDVTSNYYKLDTVAVAIDEKVLYNGTVTGVANASGKINNSYYFTSDSVTFGNPIWQNTSDKTLTFWVKYTSAGFDNWMKTQSGEGTCSGAFLIYTNAGLVSTCSNTYILNSNVTANDGNWHFIAVVFNATGEFIFQDNVFVGSDTSGTQASYGNMIWGGATYPSTFYLDEVSFFGNDLTTTQLTTLWNAGAGLTYPFTTGGSPGSNFSVTATDEWSGTSLNISVWVDGTFQYTNTTVSTTLLQNDTGLHNITIGSTNYFNRTYLNQNVSSNLAGSLHQAEVCFNASAKVSGASITANNFTIGSTVRTSCFNISAGTHNVLAQKTGWYNNNQTFTVVALQNDTQTVVNMSYANLTISAKDGTTNASLTTCDSTVKSLNFTAWSGEIQTGTFNDSYYLINGTYNVSINCSGYAYDYAVQNVTVAGHTNYTFTLYKSNSVTITILDEITNAPILSNITIRWSNNATTWENVTNTSTLFIYNLTATNYTLLFYGSNYSTRTYTISVGESTTQFLTAYMIASTYSTIMTVKDQDTAEALSDVSMTMYKLVGATWTTVESKVTDITGKAQFYYDPIGSYKFYISRSDYEDYVFYLNPILFDSYDVLMEKSSVLNYSVDFDDVSIIYSPSQFDNNENTTFNWLISSPDGQLTSYGIKLTFPGGTATASGVNAIGSQLSVVANISGATSFDYVLLEYNYTGSVSGTRQFSTTLPIIVNSSSGTWMTNKDKTYGLGIFERMLIATIIVIFVVGIGTMIGQVIPGLALGLFVFGFLSFIGFIPLWGILPSMIIGFIFLVWKSGGY